MENKKQPTAEEMVAYLGRILKKSSAAITKRKLATGEYVMHNGQAVPAYIVAEAEYEQQEEMSMKKTEFTKLRTKVLGIIEGLTLADPKYFNVRKAIIFAEKIHCNTRKDGTPEFSHQLEMLSIALPLHSIMSKPYDVYMAIIIHDTIEDYPTVQSELKDMFPDEVNYSRTLSKYTDYDLPTYYDYFNKIADCEVCSVVKLIDRVHNLSTAPGVFSNSKILDYCDEVDSYFLDMMRTAKNQFNQREVYEVLKFMLQTEVRTIRALLKNAEVV